MTNAVEMAMTVTNTVVIGHIGPHALAANTLAFGLYMVFLLFGIGVLSAVAPLVSGAVGRSADHDAEVRLIVQQGLLAGLILVVPMWIVLWRAEPILIALGQDPGLSADAAIYLHALQWALLPAFVYLLLRGAFAALGRPIWALAAGLIGVAANGGFNLLLVDGAGPVPPLGMAGSGYATVLANIVLAAALLAAPYCDAQLGRYRLLEGLSWRAAADWGSFWRLGLPIGISLLLEVGMFSGAAVLVGRVDTSALPAHAIALQVASITFMVPLGIAQAATIRVGLAFGAGDHDGLARSGWTAFGLGIAAMAVWAVVLLAAPDPIISAFLGNDPRVDAPLRSVTVTLLGLAALFQVADGAQVVLGGMLRGLHDTRVPMLVAALGYWGIGLPIGAGLAFMTGLGAPGVWIGLTAGIAAVALLLFARWTALMRISVVAPMSARP